MLSQDPDIRRSASHRHMITHLTGPFKAGAVDTPIPISERGQVEISLVTREPLLLAAPAAPLNTKGLQLDVVLPSGGETSLWFMPYTEAGAFLPVYRPPVNRDTQTAAPFGVTLRLMEVAADGTKSPLPATEIANHIEIRLLEGLMGRMIYLLGSEKQRLRRQSRELAAMRLLSCARDNALDRIGADLGVPRFAGTIAFQPPEEFELPAVFGEFNFGERRFGRGSHGEIVTGTRREPDEEYRRRLAIYRPLRISNRQQVVEWLNGPGESTELNRGLLGELGFGHRFQVIERDNEFAVAIHLMSAGSEDYRDNFFRYIRAVHLIWPSRNATAESMHDSRYLPEEERNRIAVLRNRLRRFFSFEADAAIAPMLAVALDRVGSCRRALGILTQWPVLRTQDSNGGSRYELGLGADVSLPPATELNRMAERLRSPSRSPAKDDPEVEGLLQSMKPQSAEEDPEGKWLLEPCGLSTVHRHRDTRLYISHLPNFGMTITGPSSVELSAQATLELHYRAPGDEPGNVVLMTGLEAAAAEWARSGGHPWTRLRDSEARDRWEHAITPPTEAAKAFKAAGLPAIETPTGLAGTLTRLSVASAEPTVATLRLAEFHAGRLLSGHPEGKKELRQLVSMLRSHGISSALPLVTGPADVALVVGTIGLPEAGANLSQQRATSFRWYALPIGPRGTGGGQISEARTRATFSPRAPGLSALVAVGYARHGLTDPFEFGVELPEDATLDLLQYEFLMNVLQHIHPLSIGVNTFSIRQRHVDLDEDGEPEPLQPTVSRTYRQFRRRRHRGEAVFRAEPN